MTRSHRVWSCRAYPHGQGTQYIYIMPTQLERGPGFVWYVLGEKQTLGFSVTPTAPYPLLAVDPLYYTDSP